MHMKNCERQFGSTVSSKLWNAWLMIPSHHKPITEVTITRVLITRTWSSSPHHHKQYLSTHFTTAHCLVTTLRRTHLPDRFTAMLHRPDVSPNPLCLPILCVSQSSVSPNPLCLPILCVSQSSVSPNPLCLPILCVSQSSVSPNPLCLPILCVSQSSVSPSSVSPNPLCLPILCVSQSSVSPNPLCLPIPCVSQSSVSPNPLCLQRLPACLCLQHLLIPDSTPLQLIHRSVCSNYLQN